MRTKKGMINQKRPFSSSFTSTTCNETREKNGWKRVGEEKKTINIEQC
jgi:hypothetical protein